MIYNEPDFLKSLFVVLCLLFITDMVTAQGVIIDTSAFFIENKTLLHSNPSDTLIPVMSLGTTLPLSVGRTADTTTDSLITAAVIERTPQKEDVFDNSRFIGRPLNVQPDEIPDTTSQKFIPPDLIFVPGDFVNEHNWDTLHVRRFDVSNIPAKNDTTVIPLYNEGDSPFIFPYEGQLLSPFGYRGRHFHAGVDIRCNLNDTIRCAFDGTVRIARRYGGYGNMVVVRHNNGIETLYGHLNKIIARVDQPIKAGEPIGLGGHTGHATCVHLHFETRYLGEPFNPMNIMSITDHDLLSDTLMITRNSFIRSKISKHDVKSVGKSYRGRKYYTIRKGDSLSEIARKSGVPLKKLYTLNKMKKNSVLKPGGKIKVK